jgi:hypothetical protein
MHNQVTGHLFLQKATINMNTYLDVLQLSYAVPHTQQLQPPILQSDGAPVWAYMDKKFPGR